MVPFCKSTHNLYVRSYEFTDVLCAWIVCLNVYCSSQLPHWWTWHLALTSYLHKPANTARCISPVPCSTLGLLLHPRLNSLEHHHRGAACSHFRRGAKYPFTFDHVQLLTAEELGDCTPSLTIAPVCDCAWCACDYSNELSIIARVVQHLSCESKSSSKKVIPCHNHDASLHWEGVYTVNSQQQFLRIWHFVGKSWDFHVNLAFWDSYTECGGLNVMWVSRQKRTYWNQ